MWDPRNGRVCRAVASLAVLWAALACPVGPAFAQEPAGVAEAGRGAGAGLVGHGPVFDLPGVDPSVLKGFQPLRAEVREMDQLQGYVDWSGKKIVALGRAQAAAAEGAEALMARRGAEVIALRNAMALAAGVRIGINGRVAGLKDGQIALQGHLKGFQVTKGAMVRDGGKDYWVAEVHVPMFGIEGLAGALYDAQLQATKALTAGMKRAAWATPAAPAATEGGVLVIDARGTGFNPSMFPVVTGKDGQVLLDIQTVTRQIATGRGLCAYATTDATYEQLQSMRELPLSRMRFVGLAAGPATDGMNVDGLPMDRLLLAQAAAAAAPEGQAQQGEPVTSLPMSPSGPASQAASSPASAPASSPASEPSAQPRRPGRRHLVKAYAAAGKEKATAVIADKESLELLKDPQASSLIQGGRVLIVVDAAAAGMEGRLPPAWLLASTER